MKKSKYRSPNRESQKYIIGIFGLVVAFVLMLVILGVTQNRGGAPDSGSTSSGSIAESHSESESTDTENEDAEEFYLLESAEPTLQGHNGYFTQEENGEKIWERDKRFAATWCVDANAVPDLRTFLGNQVYAVPASAITNTPVPNGQEDPTVYVQLYGYSPNIVDNDGYVRNTSVWMRQEKTGKRIYVFDTQEELDAARDAWNQGQAILNGDDDTEGVLIVNGRLVTGGYPQYVDGEWYIPLVYAAYAANPDLFRNDTQNSVLTIPLQGHYAGATVSVPYSLGSPGIPKTDSFEAGNYSANLGEGTADENYWSDEFRTGDGNACYVPASELSRYTGWYIYTNGKSVHVVTDDTDLSDMFLLNDQGNRSAANQTETGSDTIVKYTNPDDERLAAMMEADSSSASTEEGTSSEFDAEGGETNDG